MARTAGTASLGRVRRTVGRLLHRDEGTAIVEFVMISVLLVFLLFGVIQIAAVFYVRNVIAASAADGARYAAAADVEVAAGGLRANELIAKALSPSVSEGVLCTASLTRDAESGAELTRVQCKGRIRSMFIPIGVFVSVDVVAHSFKEGR